MTQAARCFPSLSQYPQMLQQNLQPDEAQDHASGEGRLALEGPAEFPSNAHAHQRQDTGGAADQRDRREDIHLKEREEIGRAHV